MESHIEDVGYIIKYICLLFEVNTSSISTVIDSTQPSTFCLQAQALVDDFLTNISSLFVESHIEDLGDFIDDIQLLFNEVDTSLVVTRTHSDPPIHSLYDRSS